MDVINIARGVAIGILFVAIIFGAVKDYLDNKKG